MTNRHVTSPTYYSVPERSPYVAGRMSYIPLSSQFTPAESLYGANYNGGFANQSVATDSQWYQYLGSSEPQLYQSQMQYFGGQTDMTDGATDFASASSLPPSGGQ